MEKEILKLVLDGEEYSISEDKKNIIGPSKEYTLDEFREEKLKNIIMFAALKEVVKDGTVLGFSDEDKLEKWLKEKDLYEEHKKNKEHLEKVLKKERSPEEWEKIKQSQVKQVEKATTRYNNFLKKHNLRPDQLKEIREKIEKEYDPFFPPKIHSLHLYDGFNYTGHHISLKGGYTYCGKGYPRYYPDFRTFNFNDKASSLILDCRSKAYIYQHITWGGTRLWVDTNLPNLRWAWWWIGGFDNKISSAIVYG